MKKFLKSMFPPKWKRSDKGERLDAIREMTANDVEVLQEIALTDEDGVVRQTACAKIEDPTILRAIASSTEDNRVVQQATKRADDILRERVLTAEDWAAALAEVSNQHCLCKIMLATDNPDLRTAVTERLTDHDAIMTALTGPCGKSALALLDMITDETDLETLSESGGNKAIRKTAKSRLDEIRKPVEEDTGPSAEELANAELAEIVDYAESVTQTYNFEAVGSLLDERKQRWNLLDPELKHPLFERFEAALKTFDDRRTEYEASQAAKEQFEAEQIQRTEEKEAIIHALGNLSPNHPTAGSEVETLTADWEMLPALDDEDIENDFQARFKAAVTSISKDLETFAKETADAERLENLCAKLEEVANGDDEAKLKDNRKRSWKDPDWTFVEAAPLKRRFETAVSAITERLATIEKSREEDHEKRLTELKAIIDEVREQVDAENRRHASNAVKNLQNKWKQLDGWSHTLLSRDFKAALDAFWEKQREFRDEREWAEWYNKGAKEKLITAVEATADMEDPREVAKVIQAAQKKWKEVGPVPHDVSDDMWDRFHAACNANYERCKEFFTEKEKEREENLEVCLKLCDEAEALSTSENWGSAVNRFKVMQQEWKAHGSLPRGKADEAYNRFRTACDAFFARLGEHHTEVDEHREDNQKAKEALVAEAKALLESDDDATHPRACIALQKRWKELGPGLKDKDDEVWAEFRQACDAFFERLEKAHEKNVPEKESVCAELESLVSKLDDEANRNELTDAVIGLQKRWKELGPLPKSYKGDAGKRFRKACDAFFADRLEDYSDMPEGRERNLAIKRDLVAQAEALAESTNWRETAAELKTLQAEWKTIGPVPKEHDKEVWRAFRAACDEFFTRRKAHFKDMDQGRKENLHAKEELLVQLEQLIGRPEEDEKPKDKPSGLDLAGELQAAFEGNFAMASGGNSKRDEVHRIQQHWKAIGPVPRGKDDDLWNRYRALLDKFYGNSRK